mgnify:CR=1 FL=1|jgi:hypothetical protein
MAPKEYNERYIQEQARRQAEIGKLAKAGYTTSQAEEHFKKYGFGNMTSVEKGLFRASQVSAYLPRNIKEIAAGLPTFLGTFIPAYGEILQEADREKLSTSPDVMRRLSKAGEQARKDFLNYINPKTVWDTMMAPYGLESERVINTISGKPGPKLSLEETGRLTRMHPANLAIDLAPLYKLPGQALSKTAIGKQLAKQSSINKAINQSVQQGKMATQAISQKNQSFRKKWESLTPNDQIAITEAITHTGVKDLGDKKLNAIMEEARDISKSISNEYINKNLIPEQVNADNIIANTMGNSLNWEGVTHSDIMKAIQNPETMPKEWKELYNQAKQLQSQGDITFLSQLVNPAENVMGIPIEKAGRYSEQARVLGTRTPAEMAALVPDAYDATISRLTGYNTLSELSRNLPEATGSLTGNALKDALKAGTDVYDLEAFGNLASQGALSGKSPKSVFKSLKKATKDTTEGFTLSPKDMSAISEAFSPLSHNPTLSAWKRSQLVTPKWIVENRIGNVINNLIEGVTPIHNLRALANWKDMPEQLRNLTSYAGLSGDAGRLVTGTGFVDALKETGSALKKLGKGDWEEGLPQLYRGTSDIVSNPVTKLESTLESWDRYSNLIKQADKLGIDYKNLTPDQFWKAYEGVNKSMGDYVGQNYYLPRGAREAVYNWVPFWKFPAQTASVTANQLINKPLGFQSFIGYPTKTGSEIYNKAIEQGYYEDPMGEGGFPTGKTDYFGNPKVMRSESIPFTTLSGLVRDITTPEQGISNIIDNLSPTFEIKDILGQKGYRGMPATSKKYITDVKTGLRFGKDKEGNITGEEYEQTLPDYLQYLTTQGIKRMWAPAVFGERVVRPFYYGLVDPVLRDVPFSEAQMYPMYSDELAPWSVGNITSQPKTGLTEILGPQVGLKTQTMYPEQTIDFKQAVRRAARKAGRSYTIPKTQNNLFRDLFR